NRFKQPDLALLEQASFATGEILKKGDVVIFESTVYPGATEEVCQPALEQASGLKCNEDFHIGYSPERINPGDETRTLKDIPKITSGSTPEASEFVDRLYKCIHYCPGKPKTNFFNELKICRKIPIYGCHRFEPIREPPEYTDTGSLWRPPCTPESSSSRRSSIIYRCTRFSDMSVVTKATVIPSLSPASISTCAWPSRNLPTAKACATSKPV